MSSTPSASLPIAAKSKRAAFKSRVRLLVGRAAKPSTAPVLASPSPSQSGLPPSNSTPTSIPQVPSSPSSPALAAVPSPSTSKDTLWDQAVQRVPLPERTAIDFTNLDKLSLLGEVKDLTVQLQVRCEANQWTLKIWNGKTIVLRDLAGNLTKLIDNFAKIGDIAIQYNPTPAALPWAGFRLVLQFALADVNNMGYMLVGLERMARSIDRCAIYEALYFRGQVYGQHVSDAAEEYKRTTIDLYATILAFQASAILFYKKNTFVRGIRAVFDTNTIQEQISAIEKKEEDVRKSAELVEVENQRVVGRTVNDNLLNYFDELKRCLAALESTIETDLRGIESKLIFAKEERQIAEQERILAKLPQAKGAAFNSYENDDRVQCLEGTRQKLLREVDDWRANIDATSLLWLSGMAGTGKSTIAKTVAYTCSAQNSNCVVVSFFFTRGAGDLSNGRKFVTTIALQLANKISPLKPHISQAIEAQPDILGGNLREQWKFLVFQPLNLLSHQSATPRPQVILIIDALDECEVERDVRQIIGLLRSVKDITPVQLRVFLTSRPEQYIRLELTELPIAERQDIVLHDVEDSIIEHDITLYFESEFKKIRKRRSLGGELFSPEVIKALVQQAGKLFIYAATTTRFIRDPKFTPSERLSVVLKDGTSATNSLTGTLDDMYTRMLQDSVFGQSHIRDKDSLAARFRAIVGPFVLLFNALNIIALSGLLGKELEIVESVLGPLHSVLHVPAEEHKHNPLRLIHLSFHDFLTNDKRCTEQYFWIDKKEQHSQLVRRCLEIMSESLKQDICRLKLPSTEISNVPAKTINHYISIEVQYACQYWVAHLAQSSIILQDDDQVHVFLQENLLHWLEALSLMGRLAQSIHLTGNLRQILLLTNAPTLTILIADINRFILSNRHIMETAPLQIYISALVFSPHQSIVRKTFFRKSMPWIRNSPRGRKNWSNFLQTLEGHSKSVNAVAFSPDGTVLASASNDQTIRLWDPATGELRNTLEGHSDLVTAVAFSPNGKFLASASNDQTIRLWDLATGELRNVLEGHSDVVNAVAFSPDGKVFVSASDDKTVRLWDPARGKLRNILEGHSTWVNAVAFSSDGKVLASASADLRIRLWDPATRKLRNTLKGHSGRGPVTAVAFSPDGKVLILVSDEQTVELWNPATGELQGKLECYSTSVAAVAFSSDGKVLALASGDTMVRLQNPTTGELRNTLEGHTWPVNAVAFSPDDTVLASASTDGTIRLWDPATRELGNTLESRSGSITSSVTAVAFSPDGTVLASASNDETIRMWDPETGELRNTLEGDSGWVTAVAFSLDGKLLASATFDHTVRLWDPATGELRNTLKGHSGSVKAVAFSPDVDRKVLASASEDQTVKLWDPTTGELRDTLKGHSHWVRAVAFSPDGKLLASASDDQTVKLWDIVTGKLLQSTEIRPAASELSFTFDGLHLQTNYGDLVKLEHPVTAQQQFDSSHSLFSCSGEWLMCNWHQLVWLPAEYRPRCYVSRGNILALGLNSGFVVFLEIDPDALEQSFGTELLSIS